MKQFYEKPDAEVVNLASLARIALIEERPDRNTRGNDDFDFGFNSGVDNDRG